MAYIGSRPDNVISRNAQNEYNYTATGGQTTFTGVDSNNNTLSYTPGNIEVYFNGARLEESDFTATNGSSVILSNAASLDDELSIVALRVFEVGSISNFSTSDLVEGTNLYFTNARADARADVRAQLKIDALVDSAPTTLDTLNELAAALGDDANFSTTVTNSIAAKLPLAGGTMSGVLTMNDTLIVNAGDNGLDVRVGTDKRILFAGNIGEIGSVAGFQATNTAGSANTAFGIRATDIRFATGSDERVRITDTGVGIGTQSPDAILHVVGGAASRPTFVHSSGYGGLQLAGTGPGSGAALIFSNDYNNSVVEEYSIHLDGANDDLVFISGDPADIATQERMRLTDDGKLGIGTNSPSNLLTVDSNAAATTSDSISVRNRGITATGHTVGLRFQYNSAVPSAIRTVNTDINSGAGRLGLFTSPDGTAGNLVERLTILPTGFVGIGNASTNPGNPLHINHNGAPGGIVAKIQSNGNPWFQQSGASSSWQIGATSNGWELYNDNTTDYRVTVANAGDVGIGTRVPSAKLEIKGTGGGTGLTFKTTDASSNENFYIMDGGKVGVRYGPLLVGIPSGTSHASGAAFQVEEAGILTVLSNGNVGIGVTDPQFKLHVNKQANNYAPTAGVDENIVGFQTSYDAAGSQLLTFSNLDGNWLDGHTGSDSAFGWLYNFQNSVRAGVVYDHRSTEKFQIFSSYGSISFITADAADGNGVPTDSNMNERMSIDPGGAIGMGVTPYSNTKLTIGGTTASYNATLMFDNNTSGGAEFFMVATDNTWSVGANKFIMGHGAPSSNNVDLEIDSDGYIHTTKERLSVGANFNATTGKRGLRVGRTVINWFNYGSQSSSRYLHIKTNLINTTTSNPEPTMSLFHIRGYTYAAHNIDSMLGFHNWSGSYYNTAYTNNGHATVVSSSWAPYRSTDNKVVIVLDLGVNTYAGVSIDYMQNYEYTWRDVEVSAYSRSTNTSGVY